MGAIEVPSPGNPSGPARIWAHPLWLLAPLGLPLLVVSHSWLPEPVRLGIGFFLLLLLPGWILDRLLTPSAAPSLAARIARAFGLSVAVGSILGMASWFFGGDVSLGPVTAGASAPPLPGRLSGVLWGEGLWTLIGSVILVARARRGFRSRGRAAPTRRIVLAALLGMVLVGAVLGFHAGGGFGYGSDAPDHVSQIREMVERDRILPRTAFYVDGDGAAVDSRKGFFHVLMAAWSLASEIEPVRLWHFLPGLLLPVALIVFFTFARRLLRGDGAALFATFLALVCFGEPLRGAFIRLGYGNQMGTLLSWVVLALALEYALQGGEDASGASRTESGGGGAGHPSPRLPLLVALAAFAAGATHMFAIIQVLFSLGVFGLALLLLHGRRHPSFLRLGRLLPAVLAGCLPPLAWRMIFAYAPLNPIHTHPQGLLFVTGKLFTILPVQWWRFLSALGFGAVLVSLFLWKRARRDDAVLYMAALSLVPILIVANPLIVPLLQPFLGYLVDRLVQTVPFLVVIAYAAGWMGRRLLTRQAFRRVLPALAFYALLAALLVPRLAGFVHAYSAAGMASARARSVLDWDDLLAATEASVPTPSVILSDPVTGYSIPALTPHYTVSVLHQHGSPSDSLALERLAACRDVLSPYVGVPEKARLCRRFHADYVLVNESFNETRDLFYASIGPDRARRERESLEAEPLLFEEIWRKESRGALLRVRWENLDALAGARAEDPASGVSLRELPAGAAPVAMNTSAGITLAGVALDTTRVGGGEDLGLTLYWRRAGAPPRFPVKVHLCLETEAPRSRLWSQAASKLDRHFQQRRSGRVYRSRLVHVPLDGQFGIEDWPEDGYIADRVVMRVPSRAVSGEYELKIKWMEETFLPNLSIRDFLNDRDLYDGETIARIEVR
jgi:hypothetical protein